MFPTSAGGPIGGFMNTFAQLVGAAAPVVSGYFLHTADKAILRRLPRQRRKGRINHAALRQYVGDGI